MYKMGVISWGSESVFLGRQAIVVRIDEWLVCLTCESGVHGSISKFVL